METLQINKENTVKASELKAKIAAYNGWAKHCNSKNLMKKLLPNEQF